MVKLLKSKYYNSKSVFLLIGVKVYNKVKAFKKKSIKNKIEIEIYIIKKTRKQVGLIFLLFFKTINKISGFC